MDVEVAKPTSTERIKAALNALVEAVRTRALKWRRLCGGFSEKYSGEQSAAVEAA